MRPFTKGIKSMAAHSLTAKPCMPRSPSRAISSGYCRKELVPAADPPMGVVSICRYGFSNVGPYLEHYSGIQVQDPTGETGYYIPYIYVTTNDGALASGREVFGAPKKLAHIELIREDGLIQGTLERPAGKTPAHPYCSAKYPNERGDQADAARTHHLLFGPALAIHR